MSEPETETTTTPEARRPGGARGAPRPTSDDLPEGARIYAWLAGEREQGLHLEAADADPDDPRGPDGGAIPWELVEWWIPIG